MFVSFKEKWFFLYKYFLVFSMIENLGQQKKLVA